MGRAGLKPDLAGPKNTRVGLGLGPSIMPKVIFGMGSGSSLFSSKLAWPGLANKGLEARLETKCVLNT